MSKNLMMITAVFGLLVFSSCEYNKEQVIPSANTCDSIPATYSKDITALIATRCAIAGCHAPADASGGQTFANYDLVKANIALIRQQAIVERTMPLDRPLSTSDYNKLKCWIDRGAQND